MAQGQNNRAVGSHDMNEHSSRSHSILTIACRWVQRERESERKERGRERERPALPNFILSLFPLIPFPLPWLLSSFSSFLSLTFLPSFLPSFLSSFLHFSSFLFLFFIFPLSSLFSHISSIHRLLPVCRFFLLYNRRGKNLIDGTSSYGKLHLIDLAGSGKKAET